jgi:hypothetical protein
VLPFPVISTLHSPPFAPFPVLGTVCLSHSLFHSLPCPSSPRFLRVLCVSALNPLSSISAFDSQLSTLAHSSARKRKRSSFLFYHLRTLLLFRGRGVSLTSRRSNDPIAPSFHTQLLCFQPIAHSLAPINPTTPLQSAHCALRATFCSLSAFSLSLRFCFHPGSQPSTVNFQPSLSPSPLQCPATIKPEG